MSSTNPEIRTRLLIISDTHGKSLYNPAENPEEARKYAFHSPLPRADVAIHCGDLTFSSHVREYQATFDVMREIDAPLKLVIPGNHDCSMDVDFWEKHCARMSFLPPEKLQRLRQWPRETYDAVERARQDGIHVLVAEGTYHFVLANGAKLTVYASPWTPRYGNWGFQYDVDYSEGGVPGGHDFQIGEDTDVAMTHGPPYGILDRTFPGAEDAGCRALLAALRRARPRVHCFGHIHESHGALLVPWDDENERLIVDRNRAANDKAAVEPLSLCPGDAEAFQIVPGKHTLFVNAAIMDVHYKPHQSPWLVDLELPFPRDEYKAKAEQTRKVLSAPWPVDVNTASAIDHSVAS
ncbi:hypothetical protein SLS53_003849 [Cytospora paraplurivora]|uniref:Calcineurin-like phosphoesterase domain-containing protein n=1 Tax=Cytospora paraplurivora TaxID=2898453 RepID=A0AAN9UCI3_9PEZI